MSPEWTLTRCRTLTAVLWANQGTVTAALRLVRDEGCGRGEWTGEGKRDSIKSQGQETQLGVLGTPRRSINTCWDTAMSRVMSSGYKLPMTFIEASITYWASSTRDTSVVTQRHPLLRHPKSLVIQ